MFKPIEHYGDASMFMHEENGLKLIIWPYNIAPVVGLQVTYLVGSRHEVTGITGAAHFLEHLMFKGSKHFDQQHKMTIHALKDTGGMVNASTHVDTTHYYDIVCKKELDVAMAMEADRMMNACLREDDYVHEMTVVRNEYERHENKALGVLQKHVWAMAYLAHPYRHPDIGWKVDIEHMPLTSIEKFYRCFYVPHNAVVTLVGDITVEEGITLAEKHFSLTLPHAQPIPLVYTTEEPQEGERHFVIRRNGHVRWVAIAHKAPRGLDDDHLVLHILGIILSSGRNAYLYHALVAQGKAQEVHSVVPTVYDPGLFITYARINKNIAPEDVVSSVLNIYEQVKQGVLTEEDVTYAKKRYITNRILNKDSIWSLLQMINRGLGCGDWKYSFESVERVEKITLDDIKNAASRYLVKNQQTTGFYMPKE